MTSRFRRASDVALILALAALPAGAQEAGAPAAPAGVDQPAAGVVASPILTLNQEAMFSQSALGRRIVAELERDRNTLAAENRRIETDLSTEEQDLTDRRPTLDAAEFARLATEFDQKVQKLRQTQDAKSRALQQRLEAEQQRFVAQASPVLAEIARDRGALAILDSSVVLMAFDVIDITGEAVERLDAAIGDGSTGFGGPNPPSPSLRPMPRVMPGLTPPAADQTAPQ